MTLKHLTLFAACLLMVLGWAATASAKSYSLAAGSGAQFHIGNGLAIPVQTAIPECTAAPCTAFPPLKIGLAQAPRIIKGTTAMATGQQFTVPAGALSHQAVQSTVGVFFSNPALYAVATSQTFKWPAKPAVFSVSGGPRDVGGTTVTLIGIKPTNSVRYSPRTGTKRFGGAGSFALNPGPNSATNGITPAAVTIYARHPAGPPPPCTHTVLTMTPFPFPGGAAHPACIGLIINAFGTGTGAAGGSAYATVTTPGAPAPDPGVVIGRFGPAIIPPILKPGRPSGTVSFQAFAGTGPGPFTAMASSTAFPWTTGMLTISAAGATPPEKFILTGGDSRNASGVGAVQMVSGAVSTRVTVGDNANRGWVRLVLQDLSVVPALSPMSLAATAGLMLLVGGYMARKRLFA